MKVQIGAMFFHEPCVFECAAKRQNNGRMRRDCERLARQKQPHASVYIWYVLSSGIISTLFIIVSFILNILGWRTIWVRLYPGMQIVKGT